VFLTQPRPPVGPPGITRRPDLPTQDPKAFSPSPYQPIPTRLRTTALDNFPSTGSNPSDSPASSFGAGRFGNGSPDPAAFGGRAGMSAAAVHDQGSPFGNRRGPFADQSRIARTPSYGNITPGRANGFGGEGYQAGEAYMPDTSPWPTHSAAAGQYSNFNSPVMPHQAASAFGTRSIHESPLLQHAAAHVYPQNEFGGALGSAGLPRASLERGGSVDAFGSGINGGPGGPTAAAFAGSAALAYAQHQQPQPNAPGGPVTNIGPSPLVTHAQPVTPYHHHQSTPSVTQSPWDTTGPIQGIRRPGPFDQHVHPTASNVFVTAPLVPEPDNNNNAWGPTSGGASTSLGQGESQKEQSSWFKASEGLIDDRWKPVPGRHELTVSNLGEHNQQLQQQQHQQQQQSIQQPQPQEPNVLDAAAVTTSPQEPAKSEPVVAEPAAPTPVAASAPATTTISAPSTTGGKKKKNSTQPPAVETSAAPASATAPSVLATKDATSPSTPASVQPQTPAASSAKSPWGIDDESKKAKTTAPTPGLREIQEAEAKKKAERERLARAAATNTAASPTATASSNNNNNNGNEEATGSFTWGLPTSQAGSRATNGVKEGSTPTSAAAAVAGGASGAGAGGASASGVPAPAAVWGSVVSTAPGTKKTMTMKEIQEEEERQKKLAVKESMAAAAAHRAYAETTTATKVRNEK
jgi:PERQ amino acid-rich with GYF domain-containing protein